MSRERESRESTRQNSPTQEGTEPNLTDVERVEDAARAIARAIEDASDDFWSAQVEATKPKNRLVGSMLFVASTWVIFFAIFSGLTLLVGVARYEVGPFHALERIGREQQQLETKQSLGEFHVDLGNSLLNVGEAKEAKDEFERAQELDPSNDSAEIGILKCELFESVEAQDYNPAIIGPKLDALVQKHPDSHVFAFRGTLRYFQVIPRDPSLPQKKRAEPYQPALSDLQEAVTRNRSNAYAYIIKGLIYYDLGQFDEYMKMSEKAHQLAPQDPIFKVTYAEALYLKKRYEDAIKEAEETTYLDSQYVWPYHYLAYIYRLTGYSDNSQWYYEQFIDMLEDEKVMSLDQNQGGIIFTTGPDSYPVYLYENSETRYYAYYSIALTAYLLGQSEDAERYVNEAKDIQVNPTIKPEIERLLKYDVNVLQEEQPWLKEDTNQFREKYLTQPN